MFHKSDRIFYAITKKSANICIYHFFCVPLRRQKCLPILNHYSIDVKTLSYYHLQFTI